MNRRRIPPVFLLMDEAEGWLNTDEKQSVTRVGRGSLVTVLNYFNLDLDMVGTVTANVLDTPGLSLTVELCQLKEVTGIQARLLATVLDKEIRHSMVFSKDPRLDLQLGSHVFFSPGELAVPAVVRFVGKVTDLRPHRLGLEVTDISPPRLGLEVTDPNGEALVVLCDLGQVYVNNGMVPSIAVSSNKGCCERVGGRRRGRQQDFGLETPYGVVTSDEDTEYFESCGGAGETECLEVPEGRLENLDLQDTRHRIEVLEEQLKTMRRQLGETIRLCEKRDSIRKTIIQQLKAAAPRAPECPVCLERMTPPTNIFHCSNGHNFCGSCTPKLVRCYCRSKIAGRAIDMEKFVRENNLE